MMTSEDKFIHAVDSGDPSSPITEADLHAYADGQLPASRRDLIQRFLASRPDQAERVHDWEVQNVMLRGLLDPVTEEPLPLRLPLRPEARQWPWRAVAASVAIAIVSAGVSWQVRGRLDAQAARLALADAAVPAAASVGGFVHRAAVAHIVYSPEVRRPVEVPADQEQALVTWLTKRMGADVKAPALSSLGYELIGGRLLPGGSGPVAQFMYGSANGQRLTLYVTREVAGQDAGFKFTKDGPINVFYWVDEHFGYAISAGADKDALLKVSQEVYRQLKPQ